MTDQSWCTTTPGLHSDGCDCAKYVECPGCRKRLKRTTAQPEKYRKHSNCDFSGTFIPKEEGCQNGSSSIAASATASSATSAPDDATDDATSATSLRPFSSDLPARDASTSATAAPALPGAEEYAGTLNDLAKDQLAAYRARVEANLTPYSQPVPVEVEQPPLLDSPAAPYSQPAGRASEAPAAPMSDLGKDMTAWMKELFYQYDNRRTSDNRSAQVAMGPSGMGTPCDRRLAFSLMRMPSVNPGGDGWAAFVGTCIHAGLAEMFLWANHGSGRFAVEEELKFDSKLVPKGTADLIDRTLFMVDDHKCQGRWSRSKLKSTGPIPTYRVQAHVYAYGARQRGERVEHVAIISWPRDESTLDDLYVWTEPYSPSIAKAAFERVEQIGEKVKEQQVVALKGQGVDVADIEGQALKVKARVGAQFDVADDCRFCPFYLPNARSIEDGCNGKR